MFTGFFHLCLFSLWELFGRLYNRWGHLCVECKCSDLCYEHTTWSGIQRMWTSLEPKWHWWNCILWCDGSAGHYWGLHTACFQRRQHICKSVVVKLHIQFHFSTCPYPFFLFVCFVVVVVARFEVFKVVLMKIEVFDVLEEQIKQSERSENHSAWCLILRMEALCFPEMSVTVYLLTWLNIPEVQNPFYLSHVILITQPARPALFVLMCVKMNTVPACNEIWKSNMVLHKSMRK